jgi:hypothetical protein
MIIFQTLTAFIVSFNGNGMFTSMGYCAFDIYISHILVMKAVRIMLPFYHEVPFGMNLLIVFVANYVCIRGSQIILEKNSNGSLDYRKDDQQRLRENE